MAVPLFPETESAHSYRFAAATHRSGRCGHRTLLGRPVDCGTGPWARHPVTAGTAPQFIFRRGPGPCGTAGGLRAKRGRPVRRRSARRYRPSPPGARSVRQQMSPPRQQEPLERRHRRGVRVAVQPGDADLAGRPRGRHREFDDARAGHRGRRQQGHAEAGRDQTAQGLRLLALEGDTGGEACLRTQVVGDPPQAVPGFEGDELLLGGLRQADAAARGEPVVLGDDPRRSRCSSRRRATRSGASGTGEVRQRSRPPDRSRSIIASP